MPLFLGDHVQVTFVGRCYSQRILLTHTYKITQTDAPGTTTVGSLTALINNIKSGGLNDIVTPHTDILSEDYTQLSIRAQVIAPIRTAYVEIADVQLGTGGPGNVANDAVCITLRTASSGRKYISNKHVGPIPVAASVNGLLTNGYRADAALLGAALNVTLQPIAAGAIYEPCVYHRSTQTSTPTTGSLVSEQARTQRRRTVGLGE